MMPYDTDDYDDKWSKKKHYKKYPHGADGCVILVLGVLILIGMLVVYGFRK